MKLAGDFFEVKSKSKTEEGFVATIQLNPEHVIYRGHFPGYPVTPGVIQLQIVHELLEAHFKKKLKLTELPQCKFLEILDPNKTPQLNIGIDLILEGNSLQIKAQGEYENETYFKLRGVYQFES